jgi:sulfate transport system ATP-binding protein
VSIHLEDVRKHFGPYVALDGVSLEIPARKLTALLGPSGSGKTTLLRIIAGLERSATGRVYLSGREASAISARERNVGFVFQHYALFKHMNVEENIGFALRMRKRPREEIRARVAELLELVQLRGHAKAWPHQLSGGQRQRVALARALAASPEVLLLDEPFGALDALVRKELRRWLRRLIEEVGVTSVFVTHDQEEALEVADQVVIMNHGRIEQVGTPEEVFERPANPFVMQFLGQVNLFHARMDGGAESESGVGAGVGAAIEGYVRPHEIAIERFTPESASASGAGNRQTNGHGVVAIVHAVFRAGPRVRVELETADDRRPLTVDLTHARAGELGLAPGDRVWVIPQEMKVFQPDYSI